MLNLDDAFETLTRMKDHLERVSALHYRLHSWLSDEEIQQMETIEKELKEDVDQLSDICYKNNICPECGGELKSRTWTDDCGQTGYTYCEDCGKRWMEEE